LELDYRQRLDSIAEDIFSYANELWLIKDVFDRKLFSQYNKKIAISSPHHNFRDALFHYNKMYEAAHKKDEEVFIKQYACIAEHLNRGLKDFIVYLCFNYYTDVLHRMLNRADKSIDSKTLCILKKIYHDYKNLVVQIRLGGQDVQHLEETETAWLHKAIEITSHFTGMLQGNTQLNNLYH